jgi:transcriptional regulator with XRE-family HTH domain
MLFADRIKELREKKQMVQRQFAAALETDTPMYSKIERGDRRAKREQITVIALVSILIDLCVKMFMVRHQKIMKIILIILRINGLQKIKNGFFTLNYNQTLHIQWCLMDFFLGQKTVITKQKIRIH